MGVTACNVVARVLSTPRHGPALACLAFGSYLVNVDALRIKRCSGLPSCAAGGVFCHVRSVPFGRAGFNHNFF